MVLRPRESFLPPALLAVAMAVASSLPTASLAAKRSEIYPEFGQRKASLGRVVLLADVRVVRVDDGTPVVRIARSHAQADTTIALMREVLVAQGLAVDTSYLASIGITFNEDVGWRIADSESSGTASRLGNPPFFVDSSLAGRPGSEKQWRAVARMSGSYVRKKKETAATIPEGAALAQALNAGALAVLRVASLEVAPRSLGKSIGALLRDEGSAKSSSHIGITIVAGGDGTIVWDDWVNAPGPMTPQNRRILLEKLAKNFTQ